MILPVKIMLTSIVCCVLGFIYTSTKDGKIAEFGAVVSGFSFLVFLFSAIWLIWR